MEGRYVQFGKDVSSEYERAILESRQRRRICSLSRSHNNTLLWAYYGGGHRGVAIGVKYPTPTSDYEVKRVTYDSHVKVQGNPSTRSADEAALDILSQKQFAWKHEAEVRIFSAEKYVPIEIEQILLGSLIDAEDEKLVRELVKRMLPHVKVVKRRVAFR